MHLIREFLIILLSIKIIIIEQSKFWFIKNKEDLMFASVKSRLFVIVFICLICVLVLMFNHAYFSQKLTSLNTAENTVLTLSADILQMRRAEKDFFTRGLPVYLEKYNKAFDLFENNLRKLDVLFSMNGQDFQLTQALIEISKYQKYFYEITNLILISGLNENQGLRKEFNDIAHELEIYLKNNKTATIDLLQMRRAEKNFFLRHNTLILNQESKYFNKLESLLKNDTKAILLLDNYQKLFLQLYDMYIKIGFNENHGLMKEMRNTIHIIESKLEMLQIRLQSKIEYERVLLRTITIFILIFTLICMIFTLKTNFKLLTDAFDRFLEFFTTSKTKHANIECKNMPLAEFKEMAELANTMINSRNKAEIELKELNDHLEERVEDGIAEIKELNLEIEDTMKEVIYTMGTIGESRSKETGNHVKRVAGYTKILAEACGLNESESEMLKQVSPMHDIGKVSIPDSVLNKPGRLTEEERNLMETHTTTGYNLLKHSNRTILKSAAIIAYQHHEKYDGTGYPQKLKGEDIHLYGRITALADVFDALGSDRVYKKAWPDDKIFTLFKEEKGKQFDPKIVDLFFENLDKILEIRKKYREEN